MLPDGYEKYVGRGKKILIDGVSREAFPLTIDEYLEYMTMRPESEVVKGSDGEKHIKYANSADKVAELMSIAYVVWATLAKQDDAIGTFADWKSKNPGFMIMGDAGKLCNEVLMATVGPVQKKK